VKYIGGYAFSGCTSLTSVTIPASVDEIETEAFKDCTKLTTVNFLGGYPTNLDSNNVFDNCSPNLVVNYPQGNASWSGKVIPGVTTKAFTPSYTLTLSPATDKDFGSLGTGYTQPAPHTITVKNAGNLANTKISIALSGTGTSAFVLDKTSLGSLDPGQSDTFTVQPKAGLASGTYSATLSVSGTGTTNTKTFTVKLAVVAITSVSISGAPAQYSLKSSGKNSVQLSASVVPEGASQAVTWATSDSKVASVDQTGLVSFTGIEGAVKITATSQANTGISGSADIKAVKNVTRIDTPVKTLWVQKGKSFTIPVVAYDDKVSVDTGLTWKSSDTKAVKVSQKGKVSVPKKTKKTKATITVTASNGKNFKVTVKISSKAVKLTKASIKAPKSLKVNATKKITVRITPTKATGQKITFSSSKPDCLSVDKAGMLTAKKKGKATITVKIGNKTIKQKITVK
jgi:hypothetical protein